MTDLTLTIPDAWWMTSNDRRHWADKARRTRNIRHMTAVLARARRIPRYEVVQITALIQYPTGGRADPGNASPTVKAAIDGLVDAGVVPADDHTHVIGPDYRREVGKGQRGTHVVRLVLTGQGVPF
jgi:crossover junction endodeoxyribonuclease RusA